MSEASGGDRLCICVLRIYIYIYIDTHTGATSSFWAVSLNPAGNIYNSNLLSGYESRPLRESELHTRIGKTDHALNAEISWLPTPLSSADETKTVEDWPVILPSSMVPS